MFTPQLFLAQKLKKDLTVQIDLIAPSVFNLFTSGGEHYLSIQKVDGEVYLGKPIPQYCSLKMLKQKELNLVTLLLRIFPQISISSLEINLLLLEGNETQLKIDFSKKKLEAVFTD